MLTNVPPPFRKREPRIKTTKRIAPATPPTLVAATYVGGTSVTLTFDRPVDVAGMDVGAVGVADGGTDLTYVGGSVSVLAADAVRVLLDINENGTPPGVTMDVAADNGIVAVDGGATWAGVNGLALPFAGQ